MSRVSPDDDPGRLVPIHELDPSLDAVSTGFRGLICLVWPYSSSKRSLSLLLRESDAASRQRKGQVRIDFHGHAAITVAESRLGIGDELVVQLCGAKWNAAQALGETPGRSISWDLCFSRRLSMKVIRPSKQSSAIELDRSSPTPEPVVSSPVRESLEDQLFSTRRSPSKLEPDPRAYWSSPAFLRTGRPSNIFSAVDIEENDEFDDSPRHKKFKIGRGSLAWRFAERTPSPEKTLPADDEPPEVPRQAQVERTPEPGLPESSPPALDSASIREASSPVDQPSYPVLPIESYAQATDASVELTQPPQPQEAHDLIPAGANLFDLMTGVSTTSAVPELAEFVVPELPSPLFPGPDIPYPDLRSPTAGTYQSDFSDAIAVAADREWPSSQASELDSQIRDSLPAAGFEIGAQYLDKQSLGSEQPASAHSQEESEDRSSEPEAAALSDDHLVEALSPEEVEAGETASEDDATNGRDPAVKHTLEEPPRVIARVSPAVGTPGSTAHEAIEISDGDSDSRELDDEIIPPPPSRLRQSLPPEEYAESVESSDEDSDAGSDEEESELVEVSSPAAHAHEEPAISRSSSIVEVDEEGGDQKSEPEGSSDRSERETQSSPRPESAAASPQPEQLPSPKQTPGLALIPVPLTPHVSSLREPSPPKSLQDSRPERMGVPDEFGHQQTIKQVETPMASQADGEQPYLPVIGAAVPLSVAPHPNLLSSTMTKPGPASVSTEGADDEASESEPEQPPAIETAKPIAQVAETGPSPGQLAGDSAQPTQELLQAETGQKEAEKEEEVSDASAPANPKVTQDTQAPYPGFRTPLSYFAALPSLAEHFNGLVDVIAVVVSTTRPSRARGGPHDFYQTMYLSDPPSVGREPGITRVEVYRRTRDALPQAETGDAMLLRDFKVQSHTQRPMLLSSQSSAWAVFGRDRKGEFETRGPPVELGAEERRFADGLQRWWGQLSDEAKVALEDEAAVAKRPGKAAASPKTATKTAALRHVLRDGASYADGSKKATHELRNGATYTDE